METQLSSAEQLDTGFRRWLVDESERRQIDLHAANIIADNVQIVPPERRQGLVIISHSSATGYCKFQLRQTLEALCEWGTAAIPMDEGIISGIKLLIATVMFIKQSTETPLSDLDARIILYLHKHAIYQHRIAEHTLIKGILSSETNINRGDVIASLTKLDQIGIIDINEQQIMLRHHLVLNLS